MSICFARVPLRSVPAWARPRALALAERKEERAMSAQGEDGRGLAEASTGERDLAKCAGAKCARGSVVAKCARGACPGRLPWRCPGAGAACLRSLVCPTPASRRCALLLSSADGDAVAKGGGLDSTRCGIGGGRRGRARRELNEGAFRRRRGRRRDPRSFRAGHPHPLHVARLADAALSDVLLLPRVHEGAGAVLDDAVARRARRRRACRGETQAGPG